MKPLSTVLLSVLFISVLCDSVLRAQSPTTSDRQQERHQEYWNRFRGPNGSGVMEDARIPLQFGPDLNVLWKVPIDGGPSSPVIWGDRIFLTAVSSATPNELAAICIDRTTGKVLWRDTITDPKPRAYYSHGSPVAPTPTVDAEQVYVSFPTYGIVCYKHDGTRVWERHLEPTTHPYGMSVSPILYRDYVIVDGGMKISRLVALDRRSGKNVWKYKSPLFGQAYSTPMIWQHPGGEDLVALGSYRLTAFDPTNGEERWFAEGFTGEVIGVPVAGEGLVFASSAQSSRNDPEYDLDQSWKINLKDYDRNGDGSIQRAEVAGGFRIPLRPELDPDGPGASVPIAAESAGKWLSDRDSDQDGAMSKTEWQAYMSGLASKFPQTLLGVRPGARGDASPSHVAWTYHKGLPEVPSLLYCRGNIYLLRNGGILTCLNASDGEEHYKNRIGAPGGYVASPIAAGDKIITASQRGVVCILQAGDTFNVLARNDFDEPILATPALTHDRLYIRTSRSLYAIGFP